MAGSALRGSISRSRAAAWFGFAAVRRPAVAPARGSAGGSLLLLLDVPIYVDLGLVDLLCFFDLIGIVRDKLHQDPRTGLVVFLNRPADRAKSADTIT